MDTNHLLEEMVEALRAVQDGGHWVQPDETPEWAVPVKTLASVEAAVRQYDAYRREREESGLS